MNCIDKTEKTGTLMHHLCGYKIIHYMRGPFGSNLSKSQKHIALGLKILFLRNYPCRIVAYVTKVNV